MTLAAQRSNWVVVERRRRRRRRRGGGGGCLDGGCDASHNRLTAAAAAWWRRLESLDSSKSEPNATGERSPVRFCFEQLRGLGD
jgi:hypothetical protein